MRILLMIMAILATSISIKAEQDPSSENVIAPRADGLYLSTRGAVQNWFMNQGISLVFDSTMTAEEYPKWQSSMKREMTRLMRHPDASDLPTPQLVKTVKRHGYTLRKWESYPLPGTVVPFLELIPDGVDADNPAAAMLCIPGFGQTKELVAGQHPTDFMLDEEEPDDPQLAAMARHYAMNGWVGVAVDNPSFGEIADNGHADYLNTSRILLEGGWSYLGYASYCDKVVLDWMKHQPYIRPDRIVISGFSLGTEPMMALGLLDDSIYAFVYNDFLCSTKERIAVMTRPDADGKRPFPNSIEHLIPEFLSSFDFPDIVAALAPRPVICVEGGMDRDFDKVASAYSIAGAPDNFTPIHYEKYSDPASRTYLTKLPKGINRSEFFHLVNCDPASHGFKKGHVIPWLHSILDE